MTTNTTAVTKDGKVRSLTPRHTELIHVQRDRWLARMRCTDPVDRDLVQRILFNTNPRLKVSWFESPVQLLRRVFDLEQFTTTRAQVGPSWIEGAASSVPSLRKPVAAELHKPIWDIGTRPSARTIGLKIQAKSFGMVATDRVITEIETMIINTLVPGRGAPTADGGISLQVELILTYPNGDRFQRENISPAAVSDLCGRAAYCEFMRDALGANSPMASTAIEFVYAAAGCYFYSLADNQVLICDRPRSVNLDDQGRVHGSLGTAVEWADGSGFCAWHGQALPVWAYLPDKLTPAAVAKVENADTRAALIDMIGIGKYLDLVGARLVSMDSVEVIKGSGEMMPRAVLEYGGRYYLEGCDGSTDRTYFMPVAPPVQARWARDEAEASRFRDDAEAAFTPSAAHATICGLDEQYCVAQS